MTFMRIVEVFYEDVVIQGGLTVGTTSMGGSDMSIPNDLDVGQDLRVVGTVTADTVEGFSNTKIPVSQKSANFTFDAAQRPDTFINALLREQR
jgi:hypothetical protein